MGSRLAARLVQAGHEVTVYNRTRGKADPLLAMGARWGESPAALAERVEVLFTLLGGLQHRRPRLQPRDG